jgi:membrane protein DedA with SNARE-associated domain
MLQMPLGRFTLLTTSGSAAWNVLLIGAGWFLGENWRQITNAVGSISDVVVIALAAGVVGGAIWWWRRGR